VGREDHDAVLAQLAEKVQEAHALGGVEARGGFVHDDQSRVAQQSHRDAEALPHPPGEAAQVLLPDLVEVRLPEQRIHGFLPLTPLRDPLQHGEVVEKVLRVDLGVDPELLRQVPERPPHLVLLHQNVDIAEPRAPAVRLLQRRQSSHQRGLTGTVGAEQSIHAEGYGERHILQGVDTIGVRLRQIADDEFPRRRCPPRTAG
jgi:hypothetical protein